MPKKLAHGRRAKHDAAMRSALFATLHEQLHAAAALAREQHEHRRTLVEKAAAYDKLKARLAETMSGQVWSADVLDTIAAILREHGVVIKDPADHPGA